MGARGETPLLGCVSRRFSVFGRDCLPGFLTLFPNRIPPIAYPGSAYFSRPARDLWTAWRFWLMPCTPTCILSQTACRLPLRSSRHEQRRPLTPIKASEQPRTGSWAKSSRYSGWGHRRRQRRPCGGIRVEDWFWSGPCLAYCERAEHNIRVKNVCLLSLWGKP